MGILLKLWKWLPMPRWLRLAILRLLNDQFLVGVTGVIFNEKNHVLVLKHTYRKTAWSLPGGYLQAKEHPKVGLAREIEEETGFKVKVIRIIKTKTDHQGRLDMSYFGHLVEGTFRPSAEVVKHMFVPVHDLPELIEDQYEQIAEGFRRKRVHDLQQGWHKVVGYLPGVVRRRLPGG